MTPEEKKRHDVLEQQKLEVQREMFRKQEYMKQLQEQSLQDRREKGQEQVKASKGKELNFGAQVKKFEPPCPPKGG